MGFSFSRLKLPSGFDRDLTLLMFSMSTRRIGMGFLQVVRVIYFALLGFSPVEIGLLLSIATFVSAIHHITFGMLSDRYGRKVFLILGGIFATMRMVIFALSSDFWMLALGQGVGAMGEGAGAGQPVVSGYISDKTDMKNRSSIFSTLAVTNALAATVGSLLAGLPTWFQRSIGADLVTSHALLFWIGAAGSLGSLLFLIPMKDVKPAALEDAVDEDVNLRDMDSVNLAISVRTQPHLDYRIIKMPIMSTKDPYMASPAKLLTGPGEEQETQEGNASGETSCLLIDATSKRLLPPLSLPKKEFMNEALRIWQEEGLPKLQLKEPWWGINLGAWNEEWEELAEAAVKGNCYKAGELYSQRRRSIG